MKIVTVPIEYMFLPGALILSAAFTFWYFLTRRNEKGRVRSGPFRVTA